MHRLGVGHITAMDLGSHWMPPLKASLDKNGMPASIVDDVSGSTDSLPFPDAHFDMVFSNGVLMHLYDLDQINRAFGELTRVTKPGGRLYVVLGPPGRVVGDRAATRVTPLLFGEYGVKVLDRQSDASGFSRAVRHPDSPPLRKSSPPGVMFLSVERLGDPYALESSFG